MKIIDSGINLTENEYAAFIIKMTWKFFRKSDRLIFYLNFKMEA